MSDSYTKQQQRQQALTVEEWKEQYKHPFAPHICQQHPCKVQPRAWWMSVFLWCCEVLLWVRVFKRYWPVGGSWWNTEHMSRTSASDMGKIMQHASEWRRQHLLNIVTHLQLGLLGWIMMRICGWSLNPDFVYLVSLYLVGNTVRDVYTILVQTYNIQLASEQYAFLLCSMLSTDYQTVAPYGRLPGVRSHVIPTFGAHEFRFGHKETRPPQSLFSYVTYDPLNGTSPVLLSPLMHGSESSSFWDYLQEHAPKTHEEWSVHLFGSPSTVGKWVRSFYMTWRKEYQQTATTATTSVSSSSSSSTMELRSRHISS